ncbi:MAG TPA: hypothetical protein PL045_01700 [Chitinophagaceae bacterium]|nr:hypothetical protein [Chitinophagaceae bacterium]
MHDKPGDMDARSGLLQVDAARKNEEFNSYLKNANDYLSIGQFDKATAVIDAALLIKNNDPGALLVKSNIQKAKEDFEKKQKEEQAKKEIEQRFSDTLLLAEQFFTSGMFEDSKQKFKKADQIKPGDSYVAKRLHAIDSIFAQRKNERQAAVQDSLNKINYNREIAKADKVFEAKDYKKAIESYKFAKSIRPAEKYPDEKISESEIILLQIEEEKKAETIKKEKEDSINKAYSNALKQGKASLVNKDYLQAFNFFSDAHTLKPQENEPAEKIIFVDSILRAIQNDNDYKKVLANAYDAMSAKDLKTALKWYDSALALKPLEEFPKARIIEINNTLRRNDSIAMMQKKKEMLTMNFEAALPVYKKADTARLELRNLDAYNGYTAFINKIDMESLGDYSTAQVSIIKNAMNYVSRLDAYKPRQANTPEELSEKYPGIDFSKAPPEQNFISPVSEDPKMKAFIAKQVLPKSNRAVAVNTSGKVQLYCRSIIFQDQKSIYFTFVIKNTDTSDYLTGPMFLQVAKKDGSSKQVLPKYISAFPLIPPHQEDTVVYVANWLILQNDEKLVFQLSDRPNSKKIILDINSTNYELERRNSY